MKEEVFTLEVQSEPEHVLYETLWSRKCGAVPNPTLPVGAGVSLVTLKLWCDYHKCEWACICSESVFKPTMTSLVLVNRIETQKK